MLITYFIVPKRMKNAVLLAGSLVFYAWGEVKYVLLMVISILIGYISNINVDSNNLTKSGTITPAVDFEHLEEVLVITELKQTVGE